VVHIEEVRVVGGEEMRGEKGKKKGRDRSRKEKRRKNCRRERKVEQ
jgi:hypothetical protein